MDIEPLFMVGDCAERVSKFWFLCVHIQEGLTWSITTSAIIKKAKTRLHFQRGHRNDHLTQNLLVSF